MLLKMSLTSTEMVSKLLQCVLTGPLALTIVIALEKLVKRWNMNDRNPDLMDSM